MYLSIYTRSLCEKKFLQREIFGDKTKRCTQPLSSDRYLKEVFILIFMLQVITKSSLALFLSTPIKVV